MATPPTLEERRAEAIATCEVVENAIVVLQNDRQTFSRFRDGVLKSVAVQTTHFPPAVARWYSQSVLIGLRRLGDRDPKSHSLRQLFDRMIAHPRDWDFAAVVALWNSTPHRYDPMMLEALAQATYGWISDASGRALNVAKVEADRAALEAILAKVRKVVNRTIAHADRAAAPSDNITWGELDAAIFDCEDLAKRYIALLTGRGYSLERGSMTPVEQTVWYRIFEPWARLDPRSYRLPGEPDWRPEDTEDAQ